MPLTDTRIRNAKPCLRPFKPKRGEDRSLNDPKFVKTDKPHKIADGQGLYLEVDPSGRGSIGVLNIGYQRKREFHSAFTLRCLWRMRVKHATNAANLSRRESTPA